MSCARGVAVFTPYCVMQVTEESVPAGRPDRGMGPPNGAPASCSEESASDAALATASSAAPLGSAFLSNTSTSRSACAAVADRQAALYWRVGWLSAAAVSCCSEQAVRVLGFRLLLCPTHTEQGPGLACRAAHACCCMSHQPCVLSRKLFTLMPSCVRYSVQLLCRELQWNMTYAPFAQHWKAFRIGRHHVKLPACCDLAAKRLRASSLREYLQACMP